MPSLRYLTEEWRAEAERRLKSELTPEQLNKATASMTNIYTDCPGGGTKHLLFRLKDGVLTELTLTAAEAPEAEFYLTGSYDVMAKVSRAEMPAQKALLSGQVKLKGNMLKAMQLASVADRINKVLSGIPAEY